ncbi:two-component system, NarL family, sensor kinase [Nitrosospira multiformis]|uniref:Two-component system, NarL family, sensor kinase n=1 Tax=Nitrosospira multiformis TaxID=1231 RepID=A0A1H9YFM6_9PROT|nr:cache domain-containing protein [Nitrosospira multiformis]SES67726.1 two-component system, NarL family, sensor kinase [Nitrosospira multiformis]
MKLRRKLILLALAPLVLVLCTVAVMVNHQSVELAKEQRDVIEPAYLTSKQDELRSYLTLAQHAIAPLHGSGRTDEAALSEAKAILHRLDYGNDGYFFVYDLQGTLLVHSRKPELIGINRLNYRDINGYPTVEMLIRKAREGGGFVQYATEKPSTGKPATKLTYSVLLPNWGWVLGTGIYLDDVHGVLAKVDEQVAVNNYDTLLWIGLAASLGMTVIIVCGLMLNIRGRREAQEAERARLSSELHDSICQRLVAAKLHTQTGLIQLAGVPSSHIAAQTTFRYLEKDLKDVLQETREIAHGLHPMILRDFGLAAALRHLAHDMENAATSIRFRSRGLVEGLPGDANLVFYRLAQECLSNVKRHSCASRAALRLTGNRGTVRLTVWDNGTGFDAGSLERNWMRGLGLGSMNARVEEAGGRLTITSKPGSTKVTATLPRPFLQRLIPKNHAKPPH